MTLAWIDWNELIPRCIEGDEASWRAMVSQATPVLMKVILPRVRNRERARDLVQDLFVKLVQNDCRILREFDTSLSSRFDAYLRVMARHGSHTVTCRDKETRIADRSLELEDFANRLAADSEGERFLVHREIREAIAQLSPKQRMAVLLFMWGLKNVEIAVVVGISEDGVGALLWRAREKLRGMAAFRQEEGRKDRDVPSVVPIERPLKPEESVAGCDPSEQEEIP